MNLLIVESPNKTRKIQSLLGSGYEVVATAGHFRDLPEGQLAVDLETFEPTYVVDKSKSGLLARIRSKAKAAQLVYLATDADREGEAISWHLQQALGLRTAKRIRFQEITKKALQDALAAAGSLDQGLVDAQQARRLLDRVVGYQVSPLLSVLGKGHSAGRVQSATLHLAVVRELEREAFKVEKFWTVAVRYANGLLAKAATFNDKGDLVDVRFPSEAAAQALVAKARGPHTISRLDTQPVERKPKAPFTTSTLLQAASAQLALSPEETMAAAQALFEEGFISYHRSDSEALSDDAVAMARAFIAKDYTEALPAAPPIYRSKAGAQEAHEAIRPTHLDDDQVMQQLNGDQLGLYQLIRKHFIACQCRPATLSQTTVELAAGDTRWRVRGSVVVFPSFLRFLGVDEDDEKTGEDEDAAARLPPVSEGQVLAVSAFEVKARQTQPPPRFTKAKLIKAMEAHGIGRPSTYSATLKTLFARDYLAEHKKAVVPTTRGRQVDEALGRAFPSLLGADYTAQLEARLDEIAAGDRRWQETLRHWYEPFSQELRQAPAHFAALLAAHPKLAPVQRPAAQPAGSKCPTCGKELLIRQGKNGQFLGCSAFPKCRYTSDRADQLKPKAERSPL